jgi:hypothetical protein
LLINPKHHLPHLIPVRRESAPKQQQIVLFPSIDLIRIEFSGKHFESSDRELVVPCECRRALKSQETTPGRRAMLGGIELPVLIAVFFVFKFPFFTSGILCKPGVGSSYPLPECFQKIEINSFTV